MLIFAAYTVPRYWSTVLQREREQQTIFAMRQYARAVYAFYDKNKAYPVKMQQILDARNPRLIRGPKDGIPDPLTGQMDWLIIPFSQTGPPIRGGGGGGGGGAGPVVGVGGGNQPATPQTAPGLPMKDYAGGPFIGVRPPKTGKSLLSLNGADSYEQWTFTYNEIKTEIDARKQQAQIINH